VVWFQVTKYIKKEGHHGISPSSKEDESPNSVHSPVEQSTRILSPQASSPSLFSVMPIVTFQRQSYQVFIAALTVPFAKLLCIMSESIKCFK
jgi:hypothetical protein